MLKIKSRYAFLLAFGLMMLALPVGVASAQTSSDSDFAAFGIIGGCICGAITLAAWGGGTFWVYNDANSRGLNGTTWAAIVGMLGLFGVLGSFLLGIIGLLCCNIPGIIGVVYYFTKRPDAVMGQQQYPPGAPMM